MGLSGGCDPEVAKRAGKIYDELAREELRFAATLGRGEEILSDMIAAAKSEDAENPTLSGDDAFTLYDTYGFPLDITTDVATEAGVVVDVDGFETAMETRETSPATRASPSTSPRAISSPPSRTNSPNPPGSPATEASWRRA